MSCTVTSTIFRLVVKLMAVIAVVHALNAGQIPLEPEVYSHNSENSHRRKETGDHESQRRFRTSDHETRLKHKRPDLVLTDQSRQNHHEQFLNTRPENEGFVPSTTTNNMRLKTTTTGQTPTKYPKIKLRKNSTDQSDDGRAGRNISRNTDRVRETEERQKQLQLQQQNTSNQSDSNVPKSLSLVSSSLSQSSNETDVLDSNLHSDVQSQNDLMDNSTQSLEQNTTDSKSSSKTNAQVSCKTCLAREQDRKYRILSLQNQILKYLQMSSPPNRTDTAIPKVPAVAHLYQNDGNNMLRDVSRSKDMMSDSPYGKRTNHYSSYYNDPLGDDFVVRTERVFTVAKQPPAKLQLNISDSIYFSPSIQLYTSKIRTAYLWFYIRKSPVRRPFIKITLERILPESHPGKPIVRNTVFSQNLLRDKAYGWKRIDMRNTLRHWLRHPMSNYGLRLKAEDDHGNNMIVLTPAPPVDVGYEPWLDTKILEPRSNSRHRRSQSLVCNEDSTESRCCRYPITFSFEDVGWNWVIAPSHFQADYCMGQCQMSMQHMTPNSWINGQMSETSGPCCSPTQLSALPLLYFDANHNIVYQILQNVMVDRCGCL